MSMNLRELTSDTHLEKTWKNWSGFFGREIPTEDQRSGMKQKYTRKWSAGADWPLNGSKGLQLFL